MRATSPPRAGTGRSPWALRPGPSRPRPTRGRRTAHPAPRWLALALVGLCSGLVLALGVTPAAAVQEIQLRTPAADSVLDGPFEVTVRVRPDGGEVIERVEARITGPTDRTLALAADGGLDAEGYQTWRTAFDPSEGLALPNGGYGVAVQVSPLVGQPVGDEGHRVRLAVPPPRRDLTAAPTGEDATRVRLSWQPVALPDFVGYRIQRRGDDASGTWSTVQDLTDPRAQEVIDQVEQAGRYRYRLIVVRGDGADGELFATSAPQGVQADPADPGTFAAPPEPDPRPNPSSEPTQAPTQPPAEPAPGPAPAPAPAPNGGGTAVRPPPGPVTVAPPPAPAPPVAPPSVVPFDDGVFEELLPFEVTESEMTVIETEAAFLDGATREGGTLAVLTEEPRDRGFVTAAAAGLLLLVIGAHVRRFLSSGRSR